jgi:hypothetical protein
VASAQCSLRDTVGSVDQVFEFTLHCDGADKVVMNEAPEYGLILDGFTFDRVKVGDAMKADYPYHFTPNGVVPTKRGLEAFSVTVNSHSGRNVQVLALEN